MQVGIAGCSGRMGLTLVKAVLSAKDMQLAAGSERPGYDTKAVKLQLMAAGAVELPIVTEPTDLAKEANICIDFTTPESSLALAKAVAEQGGVHIIGTTGFTDAQLTELKSYAIHARIVQSGNFSLGVNIIERLVEQAARALDPSYDIEIGEMHHKHKKDAPSGTALMLGQAAARGRGVALADKKVVARDGITGERKSGDIGFSVMRGGDVVGIHNVLFAGPGEVIELKHQAFNREIYAYGALHAARWAHQQQAGFYSMWDVVGG
ncbi:MAG: 4-hydroxy-tetrahydrodipicolinate reductase [Rickettsiales bacterium]|nr:4-hydroxy-tetrahydrodipicolinate reductase [Rickettsiales bacterium]